MKRSFFLILLAMVAAVNYAGAAAVDYFLKIDGIDGESTDDRHAKSIEIQSFSWATANGASSATGGGAGKVSMNDFLFLAPLTKASPQLLLSCASTNPIRRATLFVRKSDSGEEYLRFELENVLITSYQTSGSAGDVVPTDQFSLNFTRITIVYTEADGTVTTGTLAQTSPQ